MRRHFLNSLVVVAVISLLVSCKTKKAIVKAPNANEVTAPTVDTKKSENLKLLRQKDILFNTLSLKAKAKLDIGGNSNNVSMIIRIQRDEKIWVNITAFAGIEVARVLITPDSLKVRNTLQGVYLKKPFRFVHNYTNRQMNFKLLQSVLVGNTIDEFMEEKSALAQKNGVWELEGTQVDLAFRMLFNTLFKVAETNLNDLKSGQALKVVYNDYQKVDDTLFPASIKINSMAGTKKVEIEMDFSQIERNVALEFPFSVPKRYEVIN